MLSFFSKVWDFIRHPTHTRTMGLAIMLVLVSAVSLTVIVAQQQQNIKQRASGEECKLDTSSCETEQRACEQQCEAVKQNTAKFYTCNIYSYNDQNCQEQVNAIGAGTCGEQDISSGCSDLGEENGSSKTVCFEDSACAASNNDNCITNCGQQKSICDNNITVNYDNCIKVAQQEETSSPTEIPAPASSTDQSTAQTPPIGACSKDWECPSTGNPCAAAGCDKTTGKCGQKNLPDDTTCGLTNDNPARIKYCDGAGSCIAPSSTQIQDSAEQLPPPAASAPSPIDSPVTVQSPDQTNPAAPACPLKSSGDANCDGEINTLDFSKLRDARISGVLSEDEYNSSVKVWTNSMRNTKL